MKNWLAYLCLFGLFGLTVAGPGDVKCPVKILDRPDEFDAENTTWKFELDNLIVDRKFALNGWDIKFEFDNAIQSFDREVFQMCEIGDGVQLMEESGATNTEQIFAFSNRNITNTTHLTGIFTVTEKDTNDKYAQITSLKIRSRSEATNEWREFCEEIKEEVQASPPRGPKTCQKFYKIDFVNDGYQQRQFTNHYKGLMTIGYSKKITDFKIKVTMSKLITDIQADNHGATQSQSAPKRWTFTGYQSYEMIDRDALKSKHFQIPRKIRYLWKEERDNLGRFNVYFDPIEVGANGEYEYPVIAKIDVLHMNGQKKPIGRETLCDDTRHYE